MILTDTSVWVDHLRKTDPKVQELPRQRRILGHPLVCGEPALGSIRSEGPLLHALDRLPQATSGTNAEAPFLIERETLLGSDDNMFDHNRYFHRRSIALALPLLLLAAAALAQSGRSPFGVGAEKGGGDASGLIGWVLAQQNAFYLALKGQVRAATQNGSAAIALAGLSFAYGVFHAAGPGHGKAVVASYMLANEQALRRGLLISLFAALLQGAVAIALVAVLALAFNATAQHMNNAAALIEELSYVGIIALGAWLLYSKGRAFWVLLRPAAAHVHHPHRHDPDHHVHDEHCGHFHAPDPKTLGAGFSWRAALTTVAVAGSRPCSGAILVLVFTLAQGIFWIGLWSVLAMSLGTAITTGALAALAVLAKGLAQRYARSGDGPGRLLVPGLEVMAALAVLLVGVSLLAGATSARSLGG